jgi:hypothetical protein
LRSIDRGDDERNHCDNYSTLVMAVVIWHMARPALHRRQCCLTITQLASRSHNKQHESDTNLMLR